MNIELTLQELEALKLITTRGVFCQGLADRLRVSQATAARVVASLRKKGFRVSTRREQTHWCYEILPQPDSDLMNFVGFLGKKGLKHGSLMHDELIIQELEDKSKKAHPNLKQGA